MRKRGMPEELADLLRSAEVVTAGIGSGVDCADLALIARQRENRHWRCLMLAGVDVPALCDVLSSVRDLCLFPEKWAIALDPASGKQIADLLAATGFSKELLQPLRFGPVLEPARWGISHKLSDKTLSFIGAVAADASSNALCRAALLMSWNPAPLMPVWSVEVVGKVIVRAVDGKDAYRLAVAGEGRRFPGVPDKNRVRPMMDCWRNSAPAA